MAAELGVGYISIIPDTSKIAGAMKQAFNGAGDAGGEAGKSAGASFGGAFGLIAKAAGGLAVGAFFKSAITGAGDLEQSVGAIDAVFKGSAGQMHQWASTASTDVGLTQDEFNNLGTLIGSQLKNGGTAMDQLAPKTNDLIKTGADLASMFGGTTSDAVDALSSALKGERDPIERYGVSLNQAKIDAEAAALGFKKVDGSLSAEANQAATLSLIMKQTADAHGNFASEADTLAHKQQVLNAQWKDGKARIGAELLPAVSAFTGVLSSALGPAMNGAVAGIHRVVAGVTGLRDLFVNNDFSSAMREAFNVEEDSPVVAFLFNVRDAAITAKGALVSAFSGEGITSGGWVGVVERIGVGLAEARGGAIAFFEAFKAGDGDVTSSGFAGFLEALGGQLRVVFDAIAPAIAGLLPQIISLWSALSPVQIIFQAIQPLLPQIVAMFGQLASTIGGVLGTVLSSVLPMIMQLSGVLSQSLGSVLAAVLPVVVQMITMLGQTLSDLMPVLMPIIGTIIQLATTLISQLAPIIVNLVTSILPPLTTIFGDILGAIAPLIQMLAGLLIPIIQALMPVVVTVFSVIADVIKNVMQIVMGVIQVVTGIISGDWDKVWTGIQNIFGGIWNTIVSLVSGALQIIGSVIMAELTIVGGFIGDVLGNIGRFFSDTWNNITNGVRGFIDGFVGFFRDLPGKILGFMSGLGTSLFDLGKNMIQGLIDGAGSLLRNLGSFFLNLVPEFIREPFKAALGIHSPSRVFHGFGVNTVEGYIGGIDAMTGKIESAVTGMVSVPAVPSFGVAGAASLTSGSLSGPAVYVQNPFTGDYLLAQVDGRVSQGMNQVAAIAGGRSR